MALTLLVASGVALAGGATQISGVAVYDDPAVGKCPDPPPGVASDYPPLVMTGSLDGCLYTDVLTTADSPSGTYRETGTEFFVGSYSGRSGTFATTYRFEGKYEDVDNLIGEIFGRCQHPIVEGSGTGVFAGVSGRLDFKDEVETGTFFYRGHLRY
jgi:Protein of unknown function (DUF3224)